MQLQTQPGTVMQLHWYKTWGGETWGTCIGTVYLVTITYGNIISILWTSQIWAYYSYKQHNILCGQWLILAYNFQSFDYRCSQLHCGLASASLKLTMLVHTFNMYICLPTSLVSLRALWGVCGIVYTIPCTIDWSTPQIIFRKQSMLGIWECMYIVRLHLLLLILNIYSN